ncbi:hypothetical protein BDN67DRAFT_1017550 [Paxillus ammoniavirescens]|nr:hypothetical protein BDN67DRAFT_1017550 [Paxillus ammoniavirescens]
MPFNTYKWIERGCCFPDFELGVPDDLQAEHDWLLAVPSLIRLFIPQTSLPITAIPNFTTLPPVDPELLLTEILSNSIFSIHHPAKDVPLAFVHVSVPLAASTSVLLQKFGQAWLDGAKSIHDPRFPSTPLPFWTLSYWRGVAQLLEIKDAWV